MKRIAAPLIVLLTIPAVLWATQCPHDTWGFHDMNKIDPVGWTYIPDNLEMKFKLDMMNNVECIVKKAEFNKIPGSHGQMPDIYQSREVECTVSKGTSVLFTNIAGDTPSDISIIKDGVRDTVELYYCK